MLKWLNINNVALIEKLETELYPSFNVITGETGAGKSIIIDSINLVIGERASKELIRHGAQKARVEAGFDVSKCASIKPVLEKYELEAEDDELLLSREIQLSGKNVCRVNGAVVTLAALKELGDKLIDVHGQHEHQSLLSPEKHIDILDAFAHTETLPLLEKLNLHLDKLQQIKKRMSGGFISEAERERRLDMLEFQINEISAAKLKPNEEEDLLAQRKLLANSENIISSLTTGIEKLNDDNSSALAGIKSAQDAISHISGISEDYEQLYSRIESAYYELEDISFTLKKHLEEFDYDPKRLDAVESRLDAIAMLKRKYGGSIAEITEFLASCVNEKNSLLDGVALADKLQAELAKEHEEYSAIAAELSEKRAEAAKTLEALVIEQLMELGFKSAKFSVKIQKVDRYDPSGNDIVEFLLSTNAGEPLKPLSKVASGGEVSRIMLALKAIIAKTDDIDTMIFDEIDTGVSGKIAAVVGEKMRQVAQGRQVICVTHLPQIAAMADAHFSVEKNTDGEKTTTALRILGDDERCLEVARIMGTGDESALALEHARELIERYKAR